MPDQTVTVDISKRRQPMRLVSNLGDWDLELSRDAGVVTITIPLDENGKLSGQPTAKDADGNPIEATFTPRQPDAQ